MTNWIIRIDRPGQFFTYFSDIKLHQAMEVTADAKDAFAYRDKELAQMSMKALETIEPDASFDLVEAE